MAVTRIDPQCVQFEDEIGTLENDLGMSLFQLDTRLVRARERMIGKLDRVSANIAQGGAPIAQHLKRDTPETAKIESVNKVSEERYYGTAELREAIELARARLKQCSASLSNAADFIKNQFVLNEINKLLSSAENLEKIFHGLESKMEAVCDAGLNSNDVSYEDS